MVDQTSKDRLEWPGTSCVDGIHLVPEFLVRVNKGSRSDCTPHAPGSSVGLGIYKEQFPYRSPSNEQVPGERVIKYAGIKKKS